MAVKKTAKAKKTGMMKAVGMGAGIAAGLAGAYLLYGKKGSGKKAKAWVAKAKKEAAREIKMLKRVGEKEYKAVVEKAMKRYGSLEKVSMADVMRAASDAKNEWKRIKKEAEKIARMPAKKKRARKSAKRR